MTSTTPGKGAVDMAALVRSSKRATRTVTVCLAAGLVAEVEQLDRQLAALMQAKTPKASTVNDGRMSDSAPATDPEVVALADRIEALREEMRASTVDFVLRALPLKRWTELCDEHKPRRDPEDPKKLHPDDALGVDVTTFWEPLVRECLVSPTIDAATWELLMGRGVPTEDDPEADLRGLSDQQWDQLAAAAYQVNKGKVEIPFSWAASRVSRS